MLRALTRGIPDSFAHALSALPPDPPIEVALARRQHAAYCDALAACGAEVTTLPADEQFADCVFVEDTAVVIGDTALITRPGAPSRRLETEAVATRLAGWLRTHAMVEPGTLDGGDCMALDAQIFVGRSARTNAEGIAQLRRVFAPRGGVVIEVELPPGVLHLKCVCSPLAGGRVLLAEGSIDPALFRGREVIAVPAEETYAANAVGIGRHVIVAEGYPRTHAALTAAGFELHAVPVSEVRKADGSLTCQSIVV